MENTVIKLQQDYSTYTATDHKVWSKLYSRQSKLVLNKASKEFKKGFTMVSMDPLHVPDLEILNTNIHKVSDWTLVPVTGLIPNREFFVLLSKCLFPVTISMRSESEIDFSELPDIFHDIYGHVPMLVNKCFCDFMKEYSRIALEYMDDDKVVVYLERLYWYTLEMGLIKENNDLKAYGAAILTSAGEIDNFLNPSVVKRPFELREVFTSAYNNLQLQKQYFMIDSFDILFESLKEVRETLHKIR
jgi:phenylalanine-4-hydroxylase